MLLDDDLSKLSAEDLARVCRFAEDRFLNAITPLDIRLQQEVPGSIRADQTLRAAQGAVKRVLAAVNEVRMALKIALDRQVGNG